MKPYLILLAAFFVQSCYTIIYTNNDHSTTVEENNPPPPPPLYPPPGPTILIVPVQDPATPQAPVSEPARARTEGSTRNSAVADPSNQDQARARTMAPSGYSSLPTPLPSAPTTANQSSQSNQGGARERPASQTTQGPEARRR